MLHPEWSYQAVIYEMNVRQLTREGTLRAAAAKLGFLRDMGIDAVWLMPVYPIGAEGRKGSLGSYYSIRDYCAVDPGLGTMGDFDAFVAEAHRLGMKVLLDWVANHTARDARWVGEKPADWYERDAAGRRRALGLDGHRQTQLCEPRRMAGRGRRHGVLGAPARRRWFPLRHGDARARGVLE